MSISTRKGDGGETDLMFGRRVAKTDPRIVALGAVDELNAQLGVARLWCREEIDAAQLLEGVQASLVALMGELSTLDEDRERYVAAGYAVLGDDALERLDSEVERLENEEEIRFKGWATPGGEGVRASAALDVCRTVCRRAERGVLVAVGAGPASSYLNRLSDVLWLLAREAGRGARGG